MPSGMRTGDDGGQTVPARSFRAAEFGRVICLLFILTSCVGRQVMAEESATSGDSTQSTEFLPPKIALAPPVTAFIPPPTAFVPPAASVREPATAPVTPLQKAAALIKTFVLPATAAAPPTTAAPSAGNVPVASTPAAVNISEEKNATTQTDPSKMKSPDPTLLNLDSTEDRMRIVQSNEKISLQTLDAPVNEVLAMIASQNELNIVAGQDVTGTVSLTLNDLELDEALDAVLAINGYTWTRRKNVVFVSKVDAETSVSPRVQGRVSQVFSLHYVAADDVQTVITPMLSPVGKAGITTSLTTDQRRAEERIIVEDLPEYLEAIASRIAEIDRAPMQVLIEAHILQVNLNDDMAHGVDFSALARVADSAVIASSPAFTTPSAALNAITSPDYNINIIGNDLVAVLEALQTQAETKTLASPKLLVVNGQEAKIQIGDKLGYFVTTTTQTSTLQEVKFLETGVVLRVTPVLGSDGRIMMTVSPEISSGRIVPETGLPTEETTEVQSTVILRDGQAMVIGGLIAETDNESQSKIPIMGDLWGIGRVFQKRSTKRERNEIIIALVPRVIPFGEDYEGQAEFEAYRATTPLLDHRLQPVVRPEIPVDFPDAVENPRKIRVDRLMQGIKDLARPRPRPLDFYFPANR